MFSLRSCHNWASVLEICLKNNTRSASVLHQLMYFLMIWWFLIDDCTFTNYKLSTKMRTGKQYSKINYINLQRKYTWQTSIFLSNKQINELPAVHSIYLVFKQRTHVNRMPFKWRRNQLLSSTIVGWISIYLLHGKE